MKTAEIITEKGTMIVEFYEKDAPLTVKNFVDLSEKEQVQEVLVTKSSVNWMAKINIMTVEYFLWHTQEEIPEDRSSSSAIAVPIQAT